MIRKQRLEELSAISKSSIFNQVYPLQKPDYKRDVTEASNNTYVLVLLTSSLGNNTESRLLSQLWRELASKFGEVKFCEIKANMCIEGYPEKNTPTILIYKDGDIKQQVITLKEYGGDNTSLKGLPAQAVIVVLRLHCPDMESLLVDAGAVNKNDSRLLKPKHSEDEKPSGIRSGKTFQTDAGNTIQDDDWD